MPKLKTNKAAAKRFRITKTGKLTRKGTGTSHLQSTMSAKRKRNQRRIQLVHPTDAKKIKPILGR